MAHDDTGGAGALIQRCERAGDEVRGEERASTVLDEDHVDGFGDRREAGCDRRLARIAARREHDRRGQPERFDSDRAVFVAAVGVRHDDDQLDLRCFVECPDRPGQHG